MRDTVRRRCSDAGTLRLALSALTLLTLLALGAHALAADIVPPARVTIAMPVAPEPGLVGVRVVVDVLVDARGQVAQVSAEQPLSDSQRAAVTRAAKGWRFSPATVDGVARAAKISVQVVFVEAESRPSGEANQGGTSAEDDALPTQKSASEGTPRSILAQSPNEKTPSVDVVVTGDSRPLTAGRVARDQRILSAAPQRTGSDLLRTLPGVFLTQHSGEGKAHQLFFRGFDAVHGQDMEVNVAGAPVNDVSNVHGQGYAEVHFVIPEVVSELALLPGPFDPDQGDFAVAGSARYRLGYPYQGVSAKLGIGRFGRRRALLVLRPVGRPETDFAALEVYDSDGFGLRRRASRTSLLSQMTGWLTPKLAWRAMAGYYAGRFESPGVLRWDDVQAGRVERTASYDLGQGGHSLRAQLVGELSWQDDSGDTRLTPYLIRRTLDLSYNYTGALQFPTTDLTTQNNDATSVGLTGEHRRRLTLLTDQDELRVGVSVRHDAIRQAQVVSVPSTDLVDANVGVSHVAGWFGVSWHGIPRTVLHTSLRADALWFDVRDHLADVQRRSSGAHLGPKAVLDVGLAPGWHLQLAAARGFRSPQARSLGDGEQTPFTRVTATEAGTRYTLGPSFSAALNAFSSWLEDDLVFDETTSRNERAPSSRRMGVSADATARTKVLASSCGGTLAEAVFTSSDQRFVTGQTVPYVPRGVVRCDLDVEHELSSIAGRRLVGRLGWGQQLVWERPLPYAELDPGFFLADASARLAWSRFELRFDVENLFDTRWADGVFVYPSNFAAATPSALPERHMTVGAPRTWMLTLAVLGAH